MSAAWTHLDNMLAYQWFVARTEREPWFIGGCTWEAFELPSGPNSGLNTLSGRPASSSLLPKLAVNMLDLSLHFRSLARPPRTAPSYPSAGHGLQGNGLELSGPSGGPDQLVAQHSAQGALYGYLDRLIRGPVSGPRTDLSPRRHRPKHRASRCHIRAECPSGS